MIINDIYKNLSTQENSGRKIGLFRTLCAIFGGLFVAYLGMTVLVLLIPIEASKSITIPLMLNTLTWAIVALWISVSPSKWIALLRAIVPTIIFIIIIAFLF